MTDTYLIEEVINYEQRFTYQGQGKLWLKVTRQNFFEDNTEEDFYPPVELSYTGNTDDNPTLTRNLVRPSTGYYTKSNSLVEKRDASPKPILSGCTSIPVRWDFENQKADIEGRTSYSNSQLIDELLNLPSLATVSTKIRGYGGLLNKTPIGVLVVRDGVVPHISSIYECHYQFGVFGATNKTVSAKGFTEVEIKFLAQMIKKENGSNETHGSQLAIEWFVRVLPNGTNIVLSPSEVFELNKPR